MLSFIQISISKIRANYLWALQIAAVIFLSISCVVSFKTNEFFNSPFWLLDNSGELKAEQIILTPKSKFPETFIAQSRGNRFLYRSQLLKTKVAVQNFIEENRVLLESKPFAFTNKINVKYRSAKNLLSSDALILTLNDSIESLPLKVEDISRDTLPFQFSVNLPPSVYKAKVELFSQVGSVAIDTKIDPGGRVWLNATAGLLDLNFFDYLSNLFSKNVFRGLGYTFSGFCLLLAVYFLEKLHISILLLVTSLIFMVFSGTDSMSGHDETAHLTMLYQSTIADNVSQADFYEDTYQYLEAHDFYFLHKINPVKNMCPHKVIGHCGINFRPLKLYKSIAQLPIWNIQLHKNTADRLSFIFRCLTLLIIIVYMGLNFLGENNFTAISLCFLLCGTFWGYLPSVSNDLPFYFCGFLGLSALLSILHSHKNKWLVAVPIIGLLISTIWLLKGIDRSWIFFLLYLPFLLILVFPNRNPTIKHYHERFIYELLLFIVYFLLIVTLSFGIASFPRLFTEDYIGINIWQKLAELTDKQILRILGIDDFINLSNYFTFLKLHLKSLFGTFVWGHSKLPAWIYSTLFTAWIYLSFLGWLWLRKSFRLNQQLYIFGVLAAALVGTIIAMLTISVPYLDKPLQYESFTKVRLAAPSIFFYMFLPAIGAFSLKKGDSNANIISFSFIIVLISLYTMYLPQFFFYDKFW